MHRIVLQKQIEQRRVQHFPLFDAQTLHQRARGAVTDHALHRHHLQLLHQHLGVGQQTLHLRWDPGLLQLGHDEVIKLVVHHPLAIKLLNALAIQG